MVCYKCGRPLSKEKVYPYQAFDLQKGCEEVNFCSKECLSAWILDKQIGMWISLGLGIIIGIVLFVTGDAALALPMLFLPYTVRQLHHGLSGGGEIIPFMVVLLATITVVYPAYKFVQEYLQYKRLKAML